MRHMGQFQTCYDMVEAVSGSNTPNCPSLADSFVGKFHKAMLALFVWTHPVSNKEFHGEDAITEVSNSVLTQTNPTYVELSPVQIWYHHLSTANQKLADKLTNFRLTSRKRVDQTNRMAKQQPHAKQTKPTDNKPVAETSAEAKLNSLFA